MNGTDFADEIHTVIHRLLTAPGHLELGVVSRACSVELGEMARTNEHTRKFEGRPEGGPFSVVSFRTLLTRPDRPGSLVAMEVREDVQVVRAELNSFFELSMGSIEFNPRIPPEGAFVFSEQYDNRTLSLRFAFNSELLQMAVVQENFDSEGRKHPHLLY